MVNTPRKHDEESCADSYLNSPIASLLSNDSSKMFLKGGLFEHIPAPGYKSFGEEEPKWLQC
jgi:hypothetical protein